MSIPLSPSKVKKLLRYYFSGLPQPLIAKKLGISQGSVSHWVGRFGKQAENKGLLNTAKEWGMFDEIQGLRSLATELYQDSLTTEDARAGVRIIKIFIKLGAEPAQHETLVEVCVQVKDPGFISAALKLCEIKNKSGVSYDHTISQYKQTVEELPLVKGELEKAKTDLKDTSAKVANKKKELHELEDKYDLMGEKVKETITFYDEKVTNKMKESEVSQEEIDQVANLKTTLGKQGLDIPTLIKIAKEFIHDGNKD